MLFGLLTYNSHPAQLNLGDYVQSLAARQYLPRVDMLLNRERLAEYQGPPVKLILNGWFCHEPDTWVPSPSIVPHFVSFHVNSRAADRMLSPRGVEYLKRHAPIGCRDRITVALLRERGIEAHFTGCLTLTLRAASPTSAPNVRHEIIMVDPLFNLPALKRCLASARSLFDSLRSRRLVRALRRSVMLRQAVRHEVTAHAIHLSHQTCRSSRTDAERFEQAETYLQRYAQARFVITSRIHCALPCLAMGTPVLFLNAFTDLSDTCRFDGLLERLNRIDFGTDERPRSSFGSACPLTLPMIPANPALDAQLANAMRQSCERFVSGRQMGSRATVPTLSHQLRE